MRYELAFSCNFYNFSDPLVDICSYFNHKLT